MYCLESPWLNLFRDNRDSEEAFELEVIQREDDMVEIQEVFFDKVEEKMGLLSYWLFFKPLSC